MRDHRDQACRHQLEDGLFETRRRDVVGRLEQQVSRPGEGRQAVIPHRREQVRAQVGIGPRAEGGFGIAVTLKVHLPGVERALAERMVERGHFICPYSNATKGNIEVVTEVV
mgnify:CR=1 FL=1